MDGVTQKALTEALRRMERNGIVARRVIPVSPVAVEYSHHAPWGARLRSRSKPSIIGPWNIEMPLTKRVARSMGRNERADDGSGGVTASLRSTSARITRSHITGSMRLAGDLQARGRAVRRLVRRQII